MKKLKIYFMGHSIMNGLQSLTGDFDAPSIEGTQWDETYAERLTRLIQPHLKDITHEIINWAVRNIKRKNDKDSPLLDALVNQLEGSSYAKEETINDKMHLYNYGPVGLETKLSESVRDDLELMKSTVMAHNGMRTQGFSLDEKNINGSSNFPLMLSNFNNQADIVVTHIGVNDLRKDHVQTLACYDGMQYLNKLIADFSAEELTDEHNAQLIGLTMSHLLGEGYSPAAVQLFAHRAQYGTDTTLLTFSLQIFNMNIRLGHTKAYHQVLGDIQTQALEQIQSLLENLDDAEALTEELSGITGDFSNAFSLREMLFALQGFYNEHLLVEYPNQALESLFDDFSFIQALNHKGNRPKAQSASELFAEGDIEAALAQMKQCRWTPARGLLEQLSCEDANYFHVMNTVSEHAAKASAHLHTRYCHLINPEFNNAFGLFPEDIAKTGHATLQQAWSELAAMYPNTYTLDLNSFTNVYRICERPNADDIHWVQENYDDVTPLVARAVVAMLHGLSQEDIDCLVNTKTDCDPQHLVKEVSTLFAGFYQHNLTILPQFDVVTDYINRLVAKIDVSEQYQEDLHEIIAMSTADAKGEYALQYRALPKPLFVDALSRAAGASSSTASDSAQLSTQP